MEKISVRRLGNLILFLALVLAALLGCKKESESASSAAPSASPSASPLLGSIAREAAPLISGSITPALVKQDPASITHYLHYPKDAEAAKLEGAVQFYCDITEEGAVETTHALVAKNDAFKSAVQTALDWGRFTPATADGKPVRVYLGGTVLFLFDNGQPVIVVSLATQDRDRVGKLANYIQPQLIGGLRHNMERALSSLSQAVLVSGRAEVVVSVDAKGGVTGTSGISESPKGSGLGGLLDEAMKKAQFTPAYENGTPATGAVNIVANYSQF